MQAFGHRRGRRGRLIQLRSISARLAVWYAIAAMDGGTALQQEEALHVQLEELARLDQIISEMLFLSQAEANAITLDRRVLHPGSFLRCFAQDAVALAAYHGIRFVHAHEGEGEVRVDDKRLRQVLFNLLSNALHASPRGQPVLLSSRLAGGVWMIRFEDKGPGLPPTERERMFERFVRIGRTAQYKGSGLGLAICRSIVGLHHGRIFATCGSDGRGICIVIELPAEISPLTPPAESAAA